jgi:hypothetical protein
MSWYQPAKPLPYRGRVTAWGDLPLALPPHGTVLAWVQGCRCEECEREYQRFVSELAWRGPLRLPAQPEPRKLDAVTLARQEPAVRQSQCPVCGALRHQRCRSLAFPRHFAPTHPSEQAAGDRGSKGHHGPPGGRDSRLTAAPRYPRQAGHSVRRSHLLPFGAHCRRSERWPRRRAAGRVSHRSGSSACRDPCHSSPYQARRVGRKMSPVLAITDSGRPRHGRTGPHSLRWVSVNCRNRRLGRPIGDAWPHVRRRAGQRPAAGDDG